MALTEERKAGLMAYCRIDQLEEGEEALLQTFYDAAVDHLKGAGVREPEEGTERRAQYDLCVNHMVLDAYDHRGSLLDLSAMKENPTFHRMVRHLELTEATEPS